MKYFGRPAIPWLLFTCAALTVSGLSCFVLWVATLGAFKGADAFHDFASWLERLEFRYKKEASNGK